MASGERAEEKGLYLVVWGEGMRAHLQEINGCLMLAEHRSIVDGLEGGSIFMSHFGELGGMYADKAFEKIMRAFTKRYAQEHNLSEEELLRQSSVWTPSALRARVVDSVEARALAEDLEDVFEVKTKLYNAEIGK